MTKRGIRLLSFPALVLSIALFARPGFAAHTRSTAHIPDDPAGKSCPARQRQSWRLWD